MIRNLFVYGTLAPGQPNEHILREIGGKWEEASVKGKLYEKGWGAAMGYPGVVPDKRGHKVKGYLFSSDQLVNHWKELDAFEGDAYQRVVATVERSEGSRVKSYIYALKNK